MHRTSFLITCEFTKVNFDSCFCSSESSDSSSDAEESGDDDSVCPVGLTLNRARAGSVPADVANQSGEKVVIESCSQKQPLDGCLLTTTGTDAEVDYTNQATMWLGTEDGCIHIYHCGENIRLKKNRIRIQQGAPVLCIVYVLILNTKYLMVNSKI